MNTGIKKKNAHTTRDGYAYLTKRTVIRKAKSAGRLAALRAMRTMGFVITIERGWVVKKHEDGRVEKISRIIR